MPLHPQYSGESVYALRSRHPVTTFKVTKTVFRRFSLGLATQLDLDLDPPTLANLLNLLHGRRLDILDVEHVHLLLDALSEYEIPEAHLLTVRAHCDASTPLLCPPTLPSAHRAARTFALAARTRSTTLLRRCIFNTVHGDWRYNCDHTSWSDADKAEVGAGLIQAMELLSRGDGTGPWAGSENKELVLLPDGIVQVYTLDGDWHYDAAPRRLTLDHEYVD